MYVEEPSLFTLAKEWKQMNFPPAGEGISRMRNLVRIISITERNKGPTHAAVGTGLEKVMLGGKKAHRETTHSGECLKQGNPWK